MNARRPIVHVIDDESHCRKSVVTMLSTAGFDASDHASAEDFFADFVDDQDVLRCAVVDMNMTGLSGLGLLNKLALLKITLPVIVITAFGNVASAVQAMRAGAVDFLEKPFHRQALLESVRRALDCAAEQRSRCVHAKELSGRLQALSIREKQVIDLLVAAKSTKEIAAELGIGIKTVAKHRAHAFEKLQIETVVELMEQKGCLSTEPRG
jgi:FixJ family two-component response regulator